MPTGWAWEVDKDQNLAESRTNLQNTHFPDNDKVRNTRNEKDSKKSSGPEACKRHAQMVCTDGYACKYSHETKVQHHMLRKMWKIVYMVRPDVEGHPCIFYSLGELCHAPRGTCPHYHDDSLRKSVVALLNRPAWDVVVPLPFPRAHIVTPVIVANAWDTVVPLDIGEHSAVKLSTEVSLYGSASTAGGSSQASGSTPHSRSSARTIVLGCAPTATPAWDTTANWAFWHARNVKDENRRNFLAPYIESGALDNGTAPMSLIDQITQLKVAHLIPPKDGRSFHHFPLLPFELRDQIWKYYLEDERQEHRVQFHYTEQNFRLTKGFFWSQNADPVMLHICHEARQLALKHYTKVFGTKEAPATMYFHKKNCVFFHTRNTWEIVEMHYFMSGADMSAMRHIALPMRDFIKGDEKKIALALGFFVNLASLTLYIGDGLEDARVVDKKYHLKMIRGLMELYWKRNHKGRAIPTVQMIEIPAELARLYNIDEVTW